MADSFPRKTPTAFLNTENGTCRRGFLCLDEKRDRRLRLGDDAADFCFPLWRESRMETRRRPAIHRASFAARISSSERHSVAETAKHFGKTRRRDCALAEKKPRHPVQATRKAPASASRRQNHHRLEWIDDLCIRARSAGAWMILIISNRQSAPRNSCAPICTTNDKTLRRNYP